MICQLSAKNSGSRIYVCVVSNFYEQPSILDFPDISDISNLQEDLNFFLKKMIKYFTWKKAKIAIRIVVRHVERKNRSEDSFT